MDNFEKQVINYIVGILPSMTPALDETTALLSLGYSKREVAEMLGVKEVTIDKRSAKIRSRMGIDRTWKLSRHVILKLVKIIFSMEENV